MNTIRWGLSLAAWFLVAFLAGVSSLGAQTADVVSISAPAASETIVLGIRGPETPGTFPEMQESARKFVSYFLLGLALPPEAFWVNLNPQQPHSIVDARLQGTEAAGILLEADLRLKKDASMLTNPRVSQTGRQYWQRLYAKAEALGISDRIPVINRIWIVPGEISFRQDEDSLDIGQATLHLRLETDYAGRKPAAVSAAMSKLQASGIELMRELILPLLEMKVNYDPAYAQLRSLYRALSLARWYKYRRGAVFAGLPAVQRDQILQEGRDPCAGRTERIYRDYMSSLRNGEYHLTEDVGSRLETSLDMVTRQYFSGGIHLGKDMFTRNNNPAQAPVHINYRLEISLPGKQPVAALLKNIRLAKARVPEQQPSSSLLEDLPPVTAQWQSEPALMLEDVPLQKFL